MLPIYFTVRQLDTVGVTLLSVMHMVAFRCAITRHHDSSHKHDNSNNQQSSQRIFNLLTMSAPNFDEGIGGPDPDVIEAIEKGNAVVFLDVSLGEGENAAYLGRIKLELFVQDVSDG